MDKYTISIKGKLTVGLPSSEINKVNIWGYELCKGSDWSDFLEVVNKLGKENQQLKQQLAEKEKELAYMTKQAKRFNNEAQKYYEDAYCNDAIYQDKISFAVEQLKKVKSRYPRGTTMWTSNITEDGFEYVSDYIDNQIKQLKEKNND